MRFHFVMGDPGQYYLISFLVMFAVVIGFCLITAIARWHKNSRSPRLVVHAAVAGKRIQKVRHVSKGQVGMRVRYSREYYATFQVEGGEQIEFWLKYNEDEYKRLKEGDCGRLTFQGTRYLGFEKAKQSIQ